MSCYVNCVDCGVLVRSSTICEFCAEPRCSNCHAEMLTTMHLAKKAKTQ